MTDEPPVSDALADSRTEWRARAIGFGASAAATVISFGVSAVATVLLGRSLGPAGFALYGLANVALTFGSAVALGGLGIHLVAELRNDDGDRERIAEVVRSATVSALSVATLLAIGGIIVGGKAAPIGALVGVEVVLSIGQLLRSALDVQMRQPEAARATVLSRLVWLASVGVLVGTTRVPPLSAVLACRLLVAAVDAWLLGRVANVRVRSMVVGGWTRSDVAHHLKEAAPLTGATLLNGAIYRIDQPVLEEVAGARATGRYVAAARVADLLGAFAPIVAQVTLPGLLELNRQRDRAGVLKAIDEQFAFTILIAGGLTAVAIGRAEELVRTLFGSAYHGAGAAMAWLAFAEWFTFVSSVGGTALTASHRRGALVRAHVLGLVSNLLLLALLARPLGPAGAGLASAVGYSIVALTMVLRVRDDERRLMIRSCVKGLVVLGIGVAACRAGPLLVGVAVGFAAHTAGAVALFPVIQRTVKARLKAR